MNKLWLFFVFTQVSRRSKYVHDGINSKGLAPATIWVCNSRTFYLKLAQKL